MQESENRVMLLKDIVMDPEQPRKHFSQASLEELSASIVQLGMLEPPIVRRTKSGNKNQHMLVVGERRVRAATMAGLKEIPVIVRNYNDQEAREVQITENLQRENVNPMEEANAFQNLTKKGGYTVDRLAARLGKSTKYIRQRLRYCELIHLWQLLMYEGRLRLSDADLLCRFGPEQQQEFYTQYVPKNVDEMPEGWMVPTMALAEKTKNLNIAPFPTEDAKLYEKMGACGQCHYNSACSQLPFAGQENQRLCSNPGCYEHKAKLNHDRKIEEAGKKNVLLISGGIYSPDSKEQLKKIEASGKEVVRDYEVLKEPERLTATQFAKQMPKKVAGKTEAEKEEVYAQYTREVDVKEAEYNFKKTRAKEALVVAADYGVQTGETLLVYVPEPEPEAIAREEKIAEQIADLQRQKERKIKDANGAFLVELYDALKGSDAYWNNEKPLELKDTLALLQILAEGEEMYDEELKDQLYAEWGKPNAKLVDIVTDITFSGGRIGFAYKWIRRLVLGAITNYNITDAGGLSLRLLAERYLPQKLADLQKLYKGKQKEIIDSTNEKVAVLQQTAIPVDDEEPMFTEEEADKLIDGAKKAFTQLAEA